MKYNLFISYDLIAPGQHYPKVTAAIEALGSWAKIHYSLYFVSTSLNSQQACERIWQSEPPRLSRRLFGQSKPACLSALAS